MADLGCPCQAGDRGLAISELLPGWLWHQAVASEWPMVSIAMHVNESHMLLVNTLMHAVYASGRASCLKPHAAGASIP